MVEPYTREKRRPARADQFFPAGFKKLNKTRGTMAWHGTDPNEPGGTSTQLRANFPDHADLYDKHVPFSSRRQGVPHEYKHSKRSVTQLPTATYKNGTLHVYAPKHPDKWVGEWTHLHEEPNHWKSYKQLNQSPIVC